MYNSISSRVKKLEQARPAETPVNIFKDPELIEFFTNSGIFSAETVAAINAAKDEQDFAPFKLCTTHEIRRFLFVSDDEYRQEQIERLNSHLWVKLREFEPAEIEELCAIVEKTQEVDT